MHDNQNHASDDSALDRRSFLGQSAASLAAAGAAASLLAPAGRAAAQTVASTYYTLPKLPYPYDALEPYIDAKTMTIHHTKHHQAYIDKALAALKGHADLLAKAPADLIRDLKSVPEDIRTAVQNNVGGHVNHSFFWNLMGPDMGGEPGGTLVVAINKKFGDFAKFQEAFAAAAAGRFGSGWAWLVKSGDGVEITSTANQDSPLTLGQTPIIGIDVWEHAYYLNYQNRRPDYVAAWWKVVNWAQATKNFTSA